MLTVIRPSSRCFSFTFILLSKNTHGQLLISLSRCVSKCTLSRIEAPLYKNSFNWNVFPSVGLVKYKSTRNKNYKSKKRHEDDSDDDDDDDDERKVNEDYDDDNDEDDDDDDGYATKGGDREIKTCSVSSLRVDNILKTAFNISRRMVEVKFYEKKIWINGRLLLKKGNTVKIGDTIDMIVNFVKDRNDLIIVRRVELLNVKEDDDNDERVLVKIRKIKSLHIPNYEGNKEYVRDDEM